MIFSFYRNSDYYYGQELEKKRFWYSQFIPILFLLVLWMIRISEVVLVLNFYNLGIYPRRIEGLIGIISSPLIHSNFKHLIANSMSFYVLSSFLFYFYRQVSYQIFIINYLLSGIILWLIGRDSWHIGASGIIYGLASFLFFSGLIRGNIKLLTISLVTVFLYGGLLWGLFPTQPEISWEAHVSGAFSGFILSVLFKHQGPSRPVSELDNENDDEMDQNVDYFSDNELINDNDNKSNVNMN